MTYKFMQIKHQTKNVIYFRFVIKKLLMHMRNSRQIFYVKFYEEIFNQFYLKIFEMKHKNNTIRIKDLKFDI